MMKIFQRKLSFRRFRQAVIVKQSRHPANLIQLLLFAGNDFLIRCVFWKRDACLFSQRSHRLGEGDFLKLHHERKRIATNATAEAMIHLSIGGYIKRRSLLRMKRAQSDIILAALLEFYKPTNQIDYIGRITDFVYFFLWNTQWESL